MRPVMILAATILLASGCARQSVTQALVPQTGEELEVRLYPATDGAELQYFLSELAFVALFEVVPDGRARLVYPYYRVKHERSVPGLNPLRPAGQVPPLFYSPARASYSSGYFSASGPYYLYLIASRSPLPLEVIERSLRIVPRTFLTGDISESLDALEKLVVAGLSEDEWNSALLTVYPNASGIPWMVPPYSPKVQSRVPPRP